MSKAFTRESDDLPDRPDPPRQPSLLPPGAKNYVTPDGARRMREELDRLIHAERPRVAGLPESSDRKQQLGILDRRIGQLQHGLQSAEVVQSPAGTEDRVRFGATVNVRNGHGMEMQYRIVGVDEIDLDRGWVSWLSPIAKALLNARAGQRLRFALPAGEEELEIVCVTYESPVGPV